MVNKINETSFDRFYRYLGRIKTLGHALLLSSIMAGACSLLSVISTKFVLFGAAVDVQAHVLILAYLLPFGFVLLSSFVLLRSFTKLGQRNEFLSEVADRDDLTRLANRASFFRRGREMIAQSQMSNAPLSIIMLDVDHFKSINDTHGHLAGDLALQHLAEVIRQTSRENDLAARWGGEEFAILLRASDIKGATSYAERLRERVATSPLYWKGEELFLTVSAGVSQFEADVDGLDDLLLRADEALYSAKGKGRNKVHIGHYYPDQVEGYVQDVAFKENAVA